MKHDLFIDEDERPLFKIETFGFAVGGKLSMYISDFLVPNIHVEQERAGFVLRKASSESNAQNDLENMVERDQCIFDYLTKDDYSFELSNRIKATVSGKPVSVAATATGRDLQALPPPGTSSVRGTAGTGKAPAAGVSIPLSGFLVEQEIAEGDQGMFSLVFARCPPELHRTVTFELKGDISNPGPNYLSEGDQPLPTIYFIFFLAFAAAAVVWLVLLRRPVATGGQVHAVHYLMLLTVVFKIACLFCEAVRWHMMSHAGAPGFWSMMFYVLSTMKGILLFTVIMLIGSGWSLVKTTLNDKEKRIILVVLSLQVFDHIALIVLEETAPGSQGWLTWRDLLHLVDIVCCCAILFPIIWSIKKLREESESATGQHGAKAQRSIARLQLFRTFYVVVIVYIYLTRIVVFLIAATVSFEMEWLSTFITELSTLGFYVFTGYNFMPSPDSVLHQESSEEEEGDSEYGLDAALSRVGDDDVEMASLLPAGGK